MKMNRLLKYTALGAILFILIAFGAMSFVTYDVMSYTATGSEKLNPTGQTIGKALIVYDPGVSGNAKDVAATIASNLQAKGYEVDLAGIKSSIASNTSAYDVIVVGGPIIAGKITSSVQSYLSTLKPSESATIGVFTTGGVAENSTVDAFIRKEIDLHSGSSFNITSAMKVVDMNEVDQKCTVFVNSILG